MLKRLNFRCTKGHEFEALVYPGERPDCPECGRVSRQTFTVCQNFVVPAHMKAPGSKDSTSDLWESDRRHKQSAKHVAQREQEERIAKRCDDVQDSFDRHVADAVNSPKLQRAYYDMKHEEAVRAAPGAKR